MIKNYLLALIPVFVAVDAIGLVPIFLNLTKGIKEEKRRKTIIMSFFTATTVALVFILIGKWLFSALGITVGDFMIAGGAILFCIAIMDLLMPNKPWRGGTDEIGSVPIGTPLIVGPGVLTTCLIIVDQYGIGPTIVSVVLNVLFAVTMLFFSTKILKVIGKSGANALSRIMALLLAAIAVMMIRKGIFLIMHMQ